MNTTRHLALWTLGLWWLMASFPVMAQKQDIRRSGGAGGGGVANQAIAIVGSARELVVQSNATTPNSEIDVTADEVVLRDAGGTNYLAQSVNVTINLAATPGNPNALDTGTEAASTWYYVWLIYNPTTDTVAGLFSVSDTAPTLPVGYTFKARVGAVRNDATSILLRMFQEGQECYILEVLALPTTISTTYVVLSGANLTAFRGAVPPIAVRCRGTFGTATADSAIAVAACSRLGTAETSPVGEISFVAGDYGAVNFGFATGAPFEIPVRGGPNYNIQWKSVSGIGGRITITGFTLP